MFSSLFAFFFWKKHLPSQVLKDFSVENLETTPSTFLSKFSSEIYLSRIISYWGSLCSIHIFFHFLSVFSLTDTNDSQDSRERSGNHFFPVFHFHSLTNIHLVHQDFYHFFLIDLFLITRLIAKETCSP